MSDYLAYRDDVEGNPRLRLFKGSYTATWTQDGETKTKSSGYGESEKAKALQWWDGWLQDYIDKRLKDREVTFDHIATDYLDYMENGAGEHDGARVSAADRRRMYAARIKPAMGHRTMAELADDRGASWEKLFAAMEDGTAKTAFTKQGAKRANDKLARSSVRTIQDWVIRAYSFAVEDSKRITNRLVPPFKRLKIAKQAPHQSWTDEQWTEIVQKLRLQPDWRLYAAAVIGYHTMQRPWLFTLLTWDDIVDMTKRVIFFSTLKPAQYHSNDKKKVKDIPMSHELWSALREVRQLAATDDGKKLVNNERYVLGGVASIDRQFKEWLETNGYPGTIYWLKRTGVSMNLRRTDPRKRKTLEQVGAAIGVDPKTLEAHYGHVTYEDHRGFFEDMADEVPTRERLKVVE